MSDQNIPEGFVPPSMSMDGDLSIARDAALLHTIVSYKESGFMPDTKILLERAEAFLYFLETGKAVKEDTPQIGADWMHGQGSSDG